MMKKSTYSQYKIIKKSFRKGRWFVTLEKAYRKTETIPYANYSWLVGNPAFEGIPKGYLIHHLDLNELNDDISNLALMAIQPHRAYHLKHIVTEIPVSFEGEMDNENYAGLPMDKPRVLRSRGNRWRIYYRTVEADGSTKKREIYSHNGKGFKTAEQAEKFIEKLWPFKVWRNDI